MAAGGLGQRGVTLIGELGDLAPAVGGAVHPAHPAALFQPGDRVGGPALARRGRLRELAHPQGVTRRFRQLDQDLVVGVRHPRVVQQLGIHGREERVAGAEERAPRLLLLGGEPSGACHVISVHEK